MALNINGINVIEAPKNDTNLFHLSYDIKTQEGLDNNILKKELVWEILISNNGMEYYLDSPTESTLVFESTENFSVWLGRLTTCFGRKMCFQLTKTTAKIIRKDEVSYRYYLANKKPCPEKTKEFYDNFVTPVQKDIEDSDNPISKCL